MSKEVSKEVASMKIVMSNTLNQVLNKDLDVSQSNLFYGLLATLQNKGTEEWQEYDFKYVAMLAGRDSTEGITRFMGFIQNFLQNYSRNFIIEERDEEGNLRLTSFALFEKIVADQKTRKLRVKLVETDEVNALLNELTSNFTIVDFKTFVELRSKQSKALYRLLCQQNNNGIYYGTIEKLKHQLGTPKSSKYETRDFLKHVFNPAIKEIQEHFKDTKTFEVKKRRVGGRSITHVDIIMRNKKKIKPIDESNEIETFKMSDELLSIINNVTNGSSEDSEKLIEHITKNQITDYQLLESARSNNCTLAEELIVMLKFI